MSTSHNRWFRFLKKGRLLAYWEEEPNPKDRSTLSPFWVFPTRNITNLQTPYRNQQDHLYLELEGVKDLLLQFESTQQLANWAKALDHFRSKYSKEPKKIWEIQHGGKKHDHRIDTIVVSELEKHYKLYKNAESNAHFKEIHSLKGLQKSFQKISYDLLEPRCVESISKISEIQQKKLNVSTTPTNWGGASMIETGFDLEDSDRRQLKGKYYLILVTQKNPDPSSGHDDKILAENLLPATMCFNTIYVYPYNDLDDNSPMEKRIRTSDILDVSIAESQEKEDYYTVRIDTLDQIFLVSTKDAAACVKWVKIVKKSMEILEETKLTVHKELARNVDNLIWNFRKMKVDIGALAAQDLLEYFNVTSFSFASGGELGGDISLMTTANLRMHGALMKTASDDLRLTHDDRK